MLKQYVRLVRLRHWLKNLIVFLPLFFSGQIISRSFFDCVIGFLSFSFMSSCVYIINDIKDRDADRKHSVKSNRPIASGRISVRSGIILASILFVLSLLSEINNIKALAVVFAYFLINLFYSLGLKNYPILDVTLLASGFLLRLIVGSVITSVEISEWLCLTVIAGSFFMGIGKRRGEFLKEGTDKRKVLEQYTFGFLDKSMYACMTLVVVFYSLWCVTSDKKILVWTVIPVLIIMLRYSYTVDKNSCGDPVDVILSDKILIVLSILFMLAITVLVYVL